LDCFVDNAAESSFKDEHIVTPEEAQEFRDTVLSIRVSAVKL
jgi:hypothetical protein